MMFRGGVDLESKLSYRKTIEGDLAFQDLSSVNSILPKAMPISDIKEV